MKNLSSKILNHLETQNCIKPNLCQIKAAEKIDKNLKLTLEKKLFNLFQKKFVGVHILHNSSIFISKSLFLGPKIACPFSHVFLR